MDQMKEEPLTYVESKRNEKQVILLKIVLIGFPKDLFDQAFTKTKKMEMHEVIEEVFKL